MTEILTAAPSHPLASLQIGSSAIPQSQSVEPLSLHPDIPHLQPMTENTLRIFFFMS